MNDWALREAARAPERLRAFCGIPWAGGWTTGEVARCASAGASGLKLHQVSAGVSLLDDAASTALSDILDAAGAAALPALIHARMDDAAEVRALFAQAEAHPDAVIIAAHQLAPQLPLLLEAPPNVWIEVSGLPRAPAAAGDHFVPIWRAFGMARVRDGAGPARLRLPS